MTRYALAVILALVTMPAAGQGACTAREYAQYKEEARTSTGRLSIATDYCVNAIRRDTARKLGGYGAERRIEQCDSELQKGMDALMASKDMKAVGYAQGRCQGDYVIQSSRK